MGRRLNGPEEFICRQFISRLRARRPELLAHVFHIPQGGKRTRAEAGMFKAMGTRPGVSDYLVLFRAGQYPGLWIEVKAPGGSVSPAQRLFISLVREQGYAAATAFGLEELWAIFECYVDGLHQVIDMELNTITKTDRKNWRKCHESHDG